jgi:hypothetical protein
MVLKSSHWIIAVACAGSLLALSVTSAQTPTPTPQPTTGTSQVGADRIDTAVALLDRIDRVVAAARKDVEADDLVAVGTSGRAGATAKVTIRAADLDEIRAEIAQIKLLLKPSGS